MRLIDADKVQKMIEREIILETGIKQCLVTKLVQIPTVDKWHYPSKGEYPTEYGNYLVVLELEDSPNCCMRCIKFYNPKTKCFDTVCRVVAWMPLPEPPKEEI